MEWKPLAENSFILEGAEIPIIVVRSGEHVWVEIRPCIRWPNGHDREFQAIGEAKAWAEAEAAQTGTSQDA